jgi:hypothetical protein
MNNTGQHAVRTDPDGFSADVYRACNLDLRDLSDDQLRAHFRANGHEARLFGPTVDTVRFISMR